MKKRLTIHLDEDVYSGLLRVIGRHKIGQFLQELARPHVLQNAELDEGYRAMAADQEREAEALQWGRGLINGLTVDDATRVQLALRK